MFVRVTCTYILRSRVLYKLPGVLDISPPYHLLLLPLVLSKTRDNRRSLRAVTRLFLFPRHHNGITLAGPNSLGYGLLNPGPAYSPIITIYLVAYSSQSSMIDKTETPSHLLATLRKSIEQHHPRRMATKDRGEAYDGICCTRSACLGGALCLRSRLVYRSVYAEQVLQVKVPLATPTPPWALAYHINAVIYPDLAWDCVPDLLRSLGQLEVWRLQCIDVSPSVPQFLLN